MDSTAAAADKKPAGRKDEKKPTPKKPTLAPPDFSEWSEFIGTVVLRWVARAYVSVALKNIDRKMLTSEEEEDLDLDDEQLEAIAKPFAHVAIRSKFLTKHGRQILDSKDAIEASVIFFMWTGRIRRIARKYDPKPRRRSNESVSSGEPIQEAEPEAGSPGPIYRPGIGAGYN